MSELEGTEINEITDKSDVSFDSDTQKKFDSLMEDDKINKQDYDDVTSLSNSEISDKYDNLFEQGDFFKNEVVDTDDHGKDDYGNPYRTERGEFLPNNTFTLMGYEYETDENGNICKADGKDIPDENKDDNGKTYRNPDGGFIPNNTFEVNGHTYETDDSGNVCKIDEKEVPENCKDDLGNAYQTPDGELIPNNSYMIDGVLYETDSEGNIVKVNGTEVTNDSEKTEETVEKDDNGNEYMKNGELLPNNEYTINENNTYKTDEQSRITSYDSKPKYTTEGSRDLTEQKEIGGDERKSDDDGGHLVAKVLGGSEGKENLVPMRRTINRGDYKKMENEIAAACKENKDVSLHGDVEYNGDSQRPSMIRTEYQIDDKKTISQFDNKENSTELLDTLKDKISEQDYNNLCEEIEDMKSDGCDVSITSVKTEYDASGSETKVTVGMLDESTSEKTYKVYYPNKEV